MRCVFIVCVLAACDAAPTATDASITCGAGTVMEGASCVVHIPPFSCAAGSHDVDGTCVVDYPRYDLLVAETEIGANGHTKRKVVAFGTDANGSPSASEVVLRVDPADRGTLARSALSIDTFGATTYFTPCDSAAVGCIGPARIEMALANAPSVVVASIDIALVAPTEISSVAPCREPGNTLYLDGEEGSVRDGMLLITDAMWSVPYNEPEERYIRVDPRSLLQGSTWTLAIDSYKLHAPLAPGIYTNAMRWHSMEEGRPGLEFFGSRGCGPQEGAFQIHQLTATTTIITFEERCGPGGRIEGCIRLEQ